MNPYFLDTEFTGLQRNTTLISMALYRDECCFFYAEFGDYDRSQVFPWLENEVLSKLSFAQKPTSFIEKNGLVWQTKGNREEVKKHLADWIAQQGFMEIWADAPVWDWMLFCDLFGSAFHIPDNIFYLPFDLATLFRSKGIIQPVSKMDEDVSRFDFAGVSKSRQHHALEDVRVEKICFEKLIALP